MPAQAGLNDDDMAAVLNYVAQGVAKAGPGFAPFSAAEVKSIRASGAALTQADVGKLHEQVGGR
jgi:hypothetical protein